MKRVQGKPLPLGVIVTGDSVNFSVAVPKGKACKLLLYKKGEQKPCGEYEMGEKEAVGEVRFLALADKKLTEYEYNYLIEEKVVIDPYVKALSGKEVWNEKRDVQKHEIRGVIYKDEYDWEGDRPLKLPYNEVIAYSLHIRGFTKHSSSKAAHKGTFLGVIEKIPYMLELGINQIHCMPVYEFEECGIYTNYWGYGPGYYFAPKSSYAAGKDAVRELKDMVKSCHKAGIEVVLEMPFTDLIPKQMIEECLRYYMMEYHVDGYILNPQTAPMEAVYEDPILKNSKIMKHQTGFQNVMRRFLKGDEGMVDEVIYWLRCHSQKDGIYNYIANHNGFTLHDLVSYDGKHNEANGENNQDGSNYNYSWNCGAEGPSRKKSVLTLRKNQIKNAFFLVLLAQGTPCILAGDEFANTQKGNNNVYCQDNPTGWLDWSGLTREKELLDTVKWLIRIRKRHPVFAQKKELRGIDQMSCGIPDVSYHGQYAWQTPKEVASRQLGIYYSGEIVGDNDCFVAYNMHWLKHSFALPALKKGKKWYLAASTEQKMAESPVLLEEQREFVLRERTIAIFVGK